VDARMSILFREEEEEERQQWRGRIVAMPTGLGGLAITPQQQQQQQQQQPSASPAHLQCTYIKQCIPTTAHLRRGGVGRLRVTVTLES